MIITPVIFLTVVTGIAGMSDLKAFGRAGAKAMAYFLTFSTMALAAAACTPSADSPLPVCPLPASSLTAPPAQGRAVVWNYLGSVPLAGGWSVREASGTRLDLAEADSGSTLVLDLSCCGAIPPMDGEFETTIASGRRLDIATVRSGASVRQTLRTFPFAFVDLENGRPRRGQVVRVPALLTATLSCTGDACNEGRAMVLGIAYDERATRLAVEGVAGPGTSAAPLRTDGVPADIELPAPIAEVAPRPRPDVYTPEACPPR